MDERKDRGEFYPGGDRSGGAPAPQPSDKVDRVNVGEVGESYTLKDVKNKVNQIVRVIAPAVVCLALCARAATAPLEDIPNNAQVVTNEEDAVAMAAVGALGVAVSNRVEELEGATAQMMASATNELSSVLGDRIAEVTNRVEETYAKKSEIPAAPDLAPYALKSELPTDYIREGDITNFATRAWIEGQGYATEAEMSAKIEAQDLGIGEATNAVWRAMREGTNRLWAAHAAASNRVNAATNAIWIAQRAEVNALRATDTALSNRLEQATRDGDGAWRVGTNALWYAMKEGTNRLWAAHTAASNRVNAATNAIWIAHKADANALRAADTALSNRLEQATRAGDGAWRAGTNALWYAMKEGTNRLWAANAAASNRVNAATNALWIAMRAESNRLETAKTTMDAAWRAGTNATMRALRAASNELARADARLDAKIEALELTGGMTRLWSSDATTYQDATGVLWQVQVVTGLWTVVHSWTTTGLNWQGPWWWGAEGAGEDYYEGPGWYISSNTLTPMRMSEYPYEKEIVLQWSYWDEQEHSITTTCSRTVQWFTNAVNRVAYTNDLATATNGVMGEVDERFNQWGEMGTVFAATRLLDQTGGGYGEVTVSKVWETAEKVEGKQDTLPYPTNAIPYAAISGAPSGGGTSEWREEWGSVSMGDSVIFVTNGIFVLSFDGAEATDPVMAYTGGWPDGAAMYVRGSAVSGPYKVANNIRLVGYGTWPTNNFQSVWWRRGATIYVNILLEE